ncbi:type II toxin-antitoxin system RelE/ParE family toxin [Capnocytophaga bilenii]|uniref:type II toxin-antitoxin system RelE/ParE family toxin n=1 Tax=Capnocytophaga bilenii TaxID=2819369 RepID=UPI0028D31E3D|nr:type II toxin-antitoxin system RelE/ParE family toxin [Capnocytophaga bilenii]
MVIRWSFEAKKDYHNSLDYWEEHNGSFEYSSKIIKAVEELELELSNTPLYLGRYSRELQMYVRDILKGRFLIYFTVNGAEDLIEIHYFRGVKQQSIE